MSPCRSLLEAFYRAQRLDLVDVVIELLQRPAPPTLPTSSPSSVARYGNYMRERYRYSGNVPTASAQWPPVPIKKPCNLAMIKQEKVQRGEICDDYVRMTITGKVDDVLHVKSPVKLVDIFRIDQEDRKVILIEGAPGSGKSTLSWEICRRWGAGEIFQEYEAVILVQLRDPEIQAAPRLADLLPADDYAMAESVASQIVECKGEKVLFVLDGWDELPRNLRTKSLYQQLIGSWNKALLCKSAVIVTSRPISSGELHELVSSRVEIIGFTPEELRQYFSECLSGDSHAVEALLERVEENPVVASSCYLPLNAAIIVHLFLSGNLSLPTTVHGIFTSLVLCYLAHYQRVRQGLSGEAANLESLDRLPKSLRKPFRQLCTMAFSGVMKDKVTFSSVDLEALRVCADVSALGLLQAVPSLVSHGVCVYYSFLHLQIQELLAAFHISSLSGSEQISHFHKLFYKSRFAAVFQFCAGITRFQSKRKYLSKVAFLLPTRIFPMGIRDVISNMILSRNKQILVSVIRCLFEADDLSLCQFVGSQLIGKLYLSHTTLSPLDCLSVGYFLSCVCATTSGQFTVDFSYCSVDNHCCTFLMRGLSRCPTPNTTVTGHLSMYLEHNSIREEGAHCIAQLLKNSSIIRRLDLSYNNIGGSGLKSIAGALITSSSLVELELVACSVKVTEENGPVLREMLQRNSTLEVLHLSGNPEVSDTGAFFIAQGLKQNSSLRVLYLGTCGINDDGVESLSEALVDNDSLKVLRLWDNDGISEQGLSVLTECLKASKGLVELELPGCFRSADT